MFVSRIHVTREGQYSFTKLDPTKPLRATVVMEGAAGKVELNLSPAASDKIVALLADEVVAASRAAADIMTSSILTQTALLAGEHAAEALTRPGDA